ncbi:putative transposase [Leekyejoonella antrihumi]|uniref:putative transposase n=1 Tax=Leekyejoonella antrihumi TaxID=1660198 RepID=UPI001648A715|nr:helix-turn-helix domain containing protein [Leekyejoonella antrihumi]
MSLVKQQVLPFLPADAVPIGPLAGLVEDEQGGVVFICGQATFTFAADDSVGRRLAAVQLVEEKIASVGQVMAAFGTTQGTLWRWRAAFAADGVAGLIPTKKGPKGPSKLTDRMVTRIRRLDEKGLTLAAIAAKVGVDTATVRVALGRRAGSAGWQARHPGATADTGESLADPDAQHSEDPGGETDQDTADQEDANALVLPVLPVPVARRGERAAAREGLLVEAPVVLTEGAHLPVAGLLLILPALETTGLLTVFESVFGRLRNGFYGLRSVILTMLFLALLRDPRAQGATRVNPADLGRVLGLDRAPEVKTIRRKLAEVASHRRGADVQAALAQVHAAAHPDALGFLHVDGHTRVYCGKRNLPKTHVARLHMVAHATAETWVADADADPLLVVPGVPGASLAQELIRLIPELRAVIGQDRRATVIFDRGGWSAACFQALTDAGLDVLTYRKGDFDPLPEKAFAEESFTDPDGITHAYNLAEQTVQLPLGDGTGGTIRLRQIHKRTETGTQIPILTSRTDLTGAQACWRLAGRWRQENYFGYARHNFALDALDCYTDQADDPDRLVPNPTKKHAGQAVDRAHAEVAAAQAGLAKAIDKATTQAGRRRNHGTATVNPAAGQTLAAARDRYEDAKADRRETPTHVPLREVRPGARVLDEETKLVTHAIRMSAFNAESTLARMLHGHYAPAYHEARALLREAFTLPGDIHVTGDRLHVDLDPATAPRRSRALAGLCQQLTDTETTYPGTNLKIVYTVKDQPDNS